MTDPNDKAGKPKTCTACKGYDKDKPMVGLVVVKDLIPHGGRYKGGTILDPEDGKVYKAELWIEDGKLKVRGYLGPSTRPRRGSRAIECVDERGSSDE